MKIIFLVIIIIIILVLIYNFIQNKNTYKILKNDVVIIGACKNTEQFLPNSLGIIDMLSSLFNKATAIIYENDSTDKTLEILTNWTENKTRNYNKVIISEKNITGRRTQILSYARNLLLKKALEYNSKYIIVMDLDEVNHKLTKESFLTCFDYDDWAVLGANQYGDYYDLWALRTYDNWLPFDCWKCVENNSVDYCVNTRYRHLVPNGLIPVKSCFGGFTIYKSYFLKDCFYFGGIGEDEICEHVKLHEDIIKKNKGKIFINTYMLNN